jgi:hypothetical protein
VKKEGARDAMRGTEEASSASWASLWIEPTGEEVAEWRRKRR